MCWTGVPKRDEVLRLWQGGEGRKFKVFFGFRKDYDFSVDFVHLDHAYFNRGYDGGNFRVSLNHVHQIRLLDVPGDRVERLGADLRPWRYGREVVILEPSRSVRKALRKPPTWVLDAERSIRKFTDRPVRVRSKGPNLLADLQDCHAVVGLGSVAEVEAAVYGVPVFAGEDSPAFPIAESDFSKIETPRYPDRMPWLRTLSYSQWHVSEMETTKRHLERVLDGYQYLSGTTRCNREPS